MAIYHLTVQIISRSSGRSSVASACYRSSDTITNEYDGLTYDYSKKGWIKHTEIMLPSNAPDSFRNRSILWNAVESVEKTANAQLAREVEIALPTELTLEQHISLTRAYIERNFVSQGMIADFAIHHPPVTNDKKRPIDIDGNPTNDPDKMIFQNPHAHIMLTMRPLNAHGKWESKYQKSYLCRKDNTEKSIPVPQIKQAEAEGWKKQYRYYIGKKKVWLTAETADKRDLKRVDKNPKTENIPNPAIADWNSKDSLLKWREFWASMCNQALRDNNINVHIDHRSYEEQGIDKIPSVHLGPWVHEQEKKGIQTELGNLNRHIAKDNLFLDRFRKQMEQLEQRETERLKQLSSRLESLRAQHIVAAYQQIILSSSHTDEQDNIQKQLARSGAYAQTVTQLLKALETLERNLKLKYDELEKLNPHFTKKKDLIECEILEIENQIKNVRERLTELEDINKQEKTVPMSDPEVLSAKYERVKQLKEIKVQTYKEFYSLVEENKEYMKRLRELITGKRNEFDFHTEHNLKEHFGEKYDSDILIRARAEALELPVADGIKFHKVFTYKR
jgi:hypothetical protein